MQLEKSLTTAKRAVTDAIASSQRRPLPPDPLLPYQPTKGRRRPMTANAAHNPPPRVLEPLHPFSTPHHAFTTRDKPPSTFSLDSTASLGPKAISAGVCLLLIIQLMLRHSSSFSLMNCSKKVMASGRASTSSSPLVTSASP